MHNDFARGLLAGSALRLLKRGASSRAKTELDEEACALCLRYRRGPWGECMDVCVVPALAGRPLARTVCLSQLGSAQCEVM